jgi:sugar phosphate isomerase/epimerase
MIIGGIEQAISLYGFTERFVEVPEYSFDEMFSELRELGIEKFEIIGSQVFEQYPRPKAAEIDTILEAAARHGVVANSYGGYLDIGRITGRIPTDEDVILDITADLMTARDLGCRFVREGDIPLHLLPVAAGLAENYGIAVGIEVHAPSRPSDRNIQEMLEAFDRIGSDRLGFIPDFGCFIERPAEPALNRYLAMGARRDLLEHIIANRHSGKSPAQLQDEVAAMGGGIGEKVAISEFFGFLSFGPADIEGFKTLLRRALYFHSKFYHVTEELTDPTIPIEALLDAIVASGFQGVLLSEYEGHAFRLDDAHEQLDRHLRLEQKVLRAAVGE